MRLSLPFSLLAAAHFLGVCASNVQVLTPENFDKIVGKGKPALVELSVTIIRRTLPNTPSLTAHSSFICPELVMHRGGSCSFCLVVCLVGMTVPDGHA